MVRVYYHIYAIEGVESIVDEQLSLMQEYFDFPYILNVGISIATQNTPIDNIIEKFYNLNKTNYRIRDIRSNANEFVTLDLIEKDKQTFGDSDYILYIHTKGASRMKQSSYSNSESWRRIMNYFNIEKCKNVFQLFEKTEYNTYGILLCRIPTNKIYGGNFWWTKGDYVKSIDLTNIEKSRNNAEWNYIQRGKNWKPYSAYTLDHINYYYTNFKREEYAK